MSELERCAKPDGGVVYYRPPDDAGRGRGYFLGADPKDPCKGKGRLASVSTVAKAFGDGDTEGIIRWAVRETLEHGDWLSARNEAAGRGTRAHTLILEALAAGEVVPSLSALPDDERGYGQAVMRWWQAVRPEPYRLADGRVASEVVVADGEFAGRLDLLATVDGSLTVVDLKTKARSADGKFRPPDASAVAQIGGYIMLLGDAGVSAWGGLIVQAREDGSVLPVPVPASMACRAWASACRVREECREARSLARGVEQVAA